LIREASSLGTRRTTIAHVVMDLDVVVDFDGDDDVNGDDLP
jgi:hypothetical protein